MTRKANLRTALHLLGFASVLMAFVLGVILNFSAAGAAGLSFWELAMLNKFGIFMLVWNYNPLAQLGLLVLLAVGMVLIVTNKPYGGRW